MMMERTFRVDPTKPLHLQSLPDVLMTGDQRAHRILIRLVNASAAGSVSAYFLRSDGQTVLFTGERIGEDMVAVVLPEACYQAPGWAQLCVRLTDGRSVVTLLALNVQVVSSRGEVLLDPEDAVPSLDELLAQIERMEQGIRVAEGYAGQLEAVRTEMRSVISLLREVRDKLSGGDIQGAVGLLDRFLLDRDAIA